MWFYKISKNYSCYPSYLHMLSVKGVYYCLLKILSFYFLAAKNTLLICVIETCYFLCLYIFIYFSSWTNNSFIPVQLLIGVTFRSLLIRQTLWFGNSPLFGFIVELEAEYLLRSRGGKMEFLLVLTIKGNEKLTSLSEFY